MSARRLLISFSGGETSAYMTNWIMNNWRGRYSEIVVVMANTGQEREETLEFADMCDRYFGWGMKWVEARIQHGMRASPGFKLVGFESASRKGEPFEQSIMKYGIPNRRFPHCTRSLKIDPINAFARSIGWHRGSYDTAVGIRADEADRISASAKERRIVYPLVSAHPMTKPKINYWWSTMPFRLKLTGYQGNCSWCWKKTDRKHFTLASEDRSIYDFPARMESLYGTVGPEFSKSETGPDYRRVFFRRGRSTAEMLSEAKAAYESGTFRPSSDDHAVFDETLDVGGGCGESCEVYSDQSDDGGEAYVSPLLLMQSTNRATSASDTTVTRFASVSRLARLLK